MSDTIAGDATTNAVLAVNGQSNGVVDSSGDIDWFKVNLVAGFTYRIDLEGNSTQAGTLGDPLLHGVYDAGGYYISGTYDDDGGDVFNSRLEGFSPASTGTYFVSAGGYGSSTGSYTVSLTQTSSFDDIGQTAGNAGSIAVNSSATGAIEEAGDQDWFGVSLQAGVSYQIDLEGSPTLAGTLEDPYFVGVFDGAGTFLVDTADDDGGESWNSRLVFVPEFSGTYYLSAAGLGDATGSYRLSLTSSALGDDYGQSVSNAGTLAINSAVAAAIEEAGDSDWFEVSLITGHEYRIQLQGAATASGSLQDPLLDGLYSATGQLIAGTENDDGGEGLNSELTFTATSSDSYFIAASAYGSYTGTYTLSIEDLGSTDDYASAIDGAGSVNVNGYQIGTIEEAGDVDWFAVELQAGYIYQVDIEGDSSDAGTLADTLLGGIYNASGILLPQSGNDDGGEGLNSRLEIQVASTGTYYIAAGAYGANTGTYKVSVTQLGALDDWGDSAGGAGSVAIGGTAGGEIEEEGDRDWFAVQLLGGHDYEISLAGASGGSGSLQDTYLYGIHDAAGNLIPHTSDDDSGPGFDSLLEFSPTSTGTYFIAAGAWGSNTGTYQVLVTDLGASDDYGKTTATAGQIEVGGRVAGAIEESFDEDWFAVDLVAGHTYQIDLEGDSTNAGSLPDTVFRGVYDTLGNFIAATENDDGGVGYNSQLQFIPDSSGRYFLAAGAYGQNTGTYTLSINDINAADDYGESPGAAGSIEAGSAVVGEIEETGDRDWFVVYLQSGSTYQIDLEGSPTSKGSLTDPYFAGVMNESGSLVVGTVNDDGGESTNSRLEFTPSVSGNYFLSAGGYGEHTGSYTLSIQVQNAGDDFGESAGTAGTLTTGVVVSGEVEDAGDRDWFAATLQAGNLYTISLEGSSSAAGTLGDPYIWGVHDQAGNLIEGSRDDDGGEGLNSLLEFTPSVTGTYYISAGAYHLSTGTYKLSLSAEEQQVDDYGSATDSAGTVSVGVAALGAIEVADDQDWFAVTLTSGVTYRVNLEGSSTGAGTLVDPQLTGLFDASGVLISGTSDDDSGEGRNSFLLYTAERTGVHYIAATAYGNQTGSYKLSVDADNETPAGDDYASAPAGSGQLTLGVAKTGVLETAGDEDWFAMTLQAGQRYSFDLEGQPTSGGTLADTLIRGLHDSAGNLIANTGDDDGGVSTNSRVTFTPASSGTYYLAAAGYGANTGTYTLTASAVEVPSDSDTTFDIAINFNGDVSYLTYFEQAILRWQQVIVGDLPGQENTPYGFVDDLIINAEVASIDGVGGILGQAGPDAIRNGSLLPYSGTMSFDSADMAYMEEKGILADVILHEMGHVLGFSSWFFARLGLAEGTNYIGNYGLSAYRTLIADPSVTFVPLENDGGGGTAYSHFEEDIFNTELMTGFAENNPPMPLSRLTIGVMQDLGYDVSYSTADYLPPPNSSASSLQMVAGTTSSSSSIELAQPQDTSSLVHRMDKPLVLDESSSYKLEGVLISASASAIVFFETNSGSNHRVRMDGVFEKNSPQSLEDVKGYVDTLLFYSSNSPEPVLSVHYAESLPFDPWVLNDWQLQLLTNNAVIIADSPIPQNDSVNAGSGDDIIDLGAGDDLLVGNVGDDVLYAGAGNDTLDGGPGIDIAAFTDALDNHEIVNLGNVIRVEGPVSAGTDELIEVERLQFSDVSLAFDLAGNAGLAAKLLGVAFGSDGWNDRALLGIALDYFDNSGLSFAQIADMALDALIGTERTNEQVFSYIYTKVVGEAPDQDAYDTYLPLLDFGAFTQASLFVAAAEHPLNVLNIGLVGLLESGLEYYPV